MNRPPVRSVRIIFNPNATGDAPEAAADLAGSLRKGFPLEVSLSPTRAAGHAETLAYEALVADPDALVVSVSGDGGYHEVINGAMRAAAETGVRPRCAVLAAGNANDHFRSLESDEEGGAGFAPDALRPLDLLRVEVTLGEGESRVRYAHSYVGLGLTPAVAVELNRHDLNPLKELFIAARALLRADGFYVETDGRRRGYTSLLFANIDRMAKHLTLDTDARPDDGVFEVVATPLGKGHLVAALLRAFFLRPGADIRAERFRLRLCQPLPVQFDGEIQELPAGAELLVTVAPGAIESPVLRPAEGQKP